MSLVLRRVLAGIVLAWAVSGCGSDDSRPFNQVERTGTEPEVDPQTSRFLYVGSGGCYGGGVPLSAGSGTISAYDLETGAFSHVVIDYNEFSPGDMPVGIVDYDSDRVLVAVENASGRRLDLVVKGSVSAAMTYMTNTAALNGVVRALHMLADGSLLISKSTAIERFSAAKARITQGANAYIQAPAGACAATATLVSSAAVLSNGKILYTHAAASPNNKTVLISKTGYATAGDCLGTQAAPATTALPTAVLAHSSGKVFVAYGSATAANNSIYSYDLDPVTNVWSNATPAYADFSVTNGVSVMIENRDSAEILVANANATFNTVEKFGLTGDTLTRIGSRPFIEPSLFTRCIGAMAIVEQSR